MGFWDSYFWVVDRLWEGFGECLDYFRRWNLEGERR